MRLKTVASTTLKKMPLSLFTLIWKTHWHQSAELVFPVIMPASLAFIHFLPSSPSPPLHVALPSCSPLNSGWKLFRASLSRSESAMHVDESEDCAEWNQNVLLTPDAAGDGTSELS